MLKGNSQGDEALVEHLRAIFAALPVGVCSRDGERRIVYLNPFAEELTGYRERELRGEFCYHVFCHSTAGRVLCGESCAAGATLGRGKAIPPVALSLRTAAGRQLAVVSSFAPLRDSRGAPAGFVETLTPGAGAPTRFQPDVVASLTRLEVDLERRVVRRAGRPIKLTRTEFELLACLARQPGRPLRHAEVLHQVWGPECEGQNQYLHTFVSQLRHKIEVDPRRPRHLITEPHYGYRLYLRPEAEGGGQNADSPP